MNEVERIAEGIEKCVAIFNEYRGEDAENQKYDMFIQGQLQAWCPFLPWVERSRQYSTLRRMAVERELGLSEKNRKTHAILMNIGKKPETEEEWADAYEAFKASLKEKYTSSYHILFDDKDEERGEE